MPALTGTLISLTASSIARSVEFPPTATPSDRIADVLSRHDRLNRPKPLGDMRLKSFALSRCVLSARTIPPTESLPSVSVPVLSVKRMFILPAASIPAGFRTSTLSRIIFLMFEERTTAIIIGSPSGTATTITVSPSINA